MKNHPSRNENSAAWRAAISRGKLGRKVKPRTESHKAAIRASALRRYAESPELKEKYRSYLDKAREARTLKYPPQYLDETESERARRHRYGVTPERFANLWTECNSACGICGEAIVQRRGKFAIDHDHRTGQVRGLLCMPCNTSLGWFEMHGDRAVAYLQKHAPELVLSA